jgi:hypothetical protein
MALGVARPAASAPIASATAEVEIAGGHDDNMFLAASPDGLGNLNRLGGAYASVSPIVGADLATGGFRLRLAYLGDFRGAESVGRLSAHVLEGRVYLPAWRSLRMHVAGFGTAFQAARSPQDQYVSAGGELGLRWGLGETVAALAALRTEVRSLAADVTGVRDRDWLLMPVLRLPWQATSWLELSPVGGAVFIFPINNTATEDFRRWRAGADATVNAGNVSVSAGPWAGTILVANRREVHLGGSVEASVSLTTGLTLFARGEWSEPVSAGASQNYARRVALLGLSARVMAKTSTPKPVPAPRDLRPRVEGTQVRFRVEAAGATSVTVVGSWDDWSTPGHALVPLSEPGIWEASLALPRGAHRYHFVVDGALRRPPEAPRYVADDFGSEDGVIDVVIDVPAGEADAGGQSARSDGGQAR